MKVKATSIEGCYEVYPTIFEDNRGCFFESFNKAKFKQLTGVAVDFVQDNESHSSNGVFRGLHFQRGEFQQAKLVRVISGEILDVIVDLRKGSVTYGKHIKVVLSAKNKMQLFIPRGCDHGFLVKEYNTIFSYKCDNYYNKEAEGGIYFNDETLSIDWGVDEQCLILSPKDRELPMFKDVLPL